MSHLPPSDRAGWRQRRRQLEDRLRHEAKRATPLGDRRHSAGVDYLLTRTVHHALRLAGLYEHGRRNARDLRLVEVEFRFPHLPPAFDGYRILHLSDLHVGSVPELSASWAHHLDDVAADLTVITGDFQSFGKPHALEVRDHLTPLLAALAPRDGVLAVLGNHDNAELVDILEERGITVLVNQSHTLNRQDEHIHLVGTDDVHCFYTPAAAEALAACRDGFRIALVHSPELADQAAEAGYALYLSGHTHGGQVALPGGRPLITMLDCHQRLASGMWRHGQMQGYTSAGAGASNPPVRFNTRPEAALIRLMRS